VLFPEQLEDWITEDNPVRAVDAFIDDRRFCRISRIERRSDILLSTLRRYVEAMGASSNWWPAFQTGLPLSSSTSLPPLLRLGSRGLSQSGRDRGLVGPRSRS
jgi:hypothetical protein